MAALFLYHAPSLLPHTPRFAIAVYPLLIIFATYDFNNFLKHKSSSTYHWKTILVIIAIVGILLSPLFQTYLEGDSHNYLTSRYGQISRNPSLSSSEKLQAIREGKLYSAALAWEYINSNTEDANTSVLTEDQRLFYLDLFGYTPHSIPNKYDASNIEKWLLEKNIGWIITTEEEGLLYPCLANTSYLEMVYDPKNLVPSNRSIHIEIFGISLMEFSDCYLQYIHIYRLEIFNKTLFRGSDRLSDFKVYRVTL